MDIMDPGAEGGKCKVVHDGLQGCGPSRLSVKFKEVGPDTPDCPDPHGLPPQGVMLANRATSTATSRWGVVLPTPVRGCARGRDVYY